MTLSPAPVNPYRIATAIRSYENFFGRKEQLQNVFEHIFKGESVNVVGERRSGKSSFLRHMLHPQVRDRYAIDDGSDIYVRLDAQICPQEVQGFYRELLSGVKEQCPDLSIALDEKEMDERRVLNMLEALKPRRLVLLVDEFEWISQCENFPLEFFVFLRGLSDNYRISFILATCKNLAENCSQDFYTSPFPNIFRNVRIGPFTEKAFQEFLDKTSETGGFPLTKVGDEIVDLAGYLPYLVQVACWHYFHAWTKYGQLVPEVHQSAQQGFEERARYHFSSMWEHHLSDKERRVLTALADDQPSPWPHVTRLLEQKGYVHDGAIAGQALAAYVASHAKDSEVGMVALASEKEIPAHGLHVDIEGGNVYVEGERLEPALPKYQFRLLKLLYENRDKVCTTDTIVKNVWPKENYYEVDDQRIHALVSRLRGRIEPDGRPWKYIRTVRGRGLVLRSGAES